MINDDEFKQVMCDHMRQQTQFLESINMVAQAYSENWRAVKNVYWFLKWAVSIAAGGFGFLEAWKALFPHK